MKITASIVVPRNDTGTILLIQQLREHGTLVENVTPTTGFSGMEFVAEVDQSRVQRIDELIDQISERVMYPVHRYLVDGDTTSEELLGGNRALAAEYFRRKALYFAVKAGDVAMAKELSANAIFTTH